jgi:dihydroorotase
MVDLKKDYTVSNKNILYKCGWSPLEGFNFNATIEKTMVSGNMVYEKGVVNASYVGKRLEFERH